MGGEAILVHGSAPGLVRDRRDEYDEKRDAWPFRLTDAGRAALQDRDRYDMEPVYGGMVEPGWTATPSPKAAAAPA